MEGRRGEGGREGGSEGGRDRWRRGLTHQHHIKVLLQDLSISDLDCRGGRHLIEY